MSSRNDALKILIIEDNPGDAYIMVGLLQELGLSMDITQVKDGRDALIHLMRTSPTDPPDLVILDLNLPKVSGYEVLGMMKASPALKDISVVVMTGSLNPEDEVRSRRLGANDYCIKPATSDEMNRTQSCLRNQLEIICHAKGARCDPKGSSMITGDLQSPFQLPDPNTISNGRKFGSTNHLDLPGHWKST